MARKIIDYNILVDTDVIALQKTVSLHIKLGWQPLGGPFVFPRQMMRDQARFGQGMALYKKKGEDKETVQAKSTEPANYFVFLSGVDDLPSGFYLGGTDTVASRGPWEAALVMSLEGATKIVERALSFGHPATLIAEKLSTRAR
jgi:hypothetical protein